METLTKITAITALMSAFAVNAAAPEVNFNVEASVPDNTFYVVGTGWESDTQKMAWDENTVALRSFNQNLKMKNASGGIKAWLLESPKLASASSNNEIELDITIAGKELGVSSANAAELYTKDEVKTEKQATVSVSQKSEFTQATRPAAGTYTGSVTMVFDTIPDVKP